MSQTYETHVEWHRATLNNKMGVKTSERSKWEEVCSNYADVWIEESIGELWYFPDV